MMDSWWRLGEGSGYNGDTLAEYSIICPFCQEKGNFTTVSHFEKKKPNSTKKLNFDTLECGSCKGYVMVLWSADEFGFGHRRIHDFRVLPYPIRTAEYPKHWPEQIGRFWLQAKRNLEDENWDAASVMARSSLQAALRDCNSSGKTLKTEIEDLASKGILPPLMKDWSDNVRELGNESAHPKPGQPPTAPEDARDIVAFLDFLLQYLYTLPRKIEAFRSRNKNADE